MATPTFVGSDAWTADAADPVDRDIGTLTGSNRYLVVIWGYEVTRTVSAITYGGQALTLLAATSPVSEATSGKDIFFYGLNEAGIAAASGTTLSINLSANVSQGVFTAMWFSDVEQTTPISDPQSGAAFNSTAVSTAAVTSSADAFVVGGACCRDSDSLYAINNASATEVADMGAGAGDAASNRVTCFYIPGAASVTPDLTISNHSVTPAWVAVAASLNGITAGGSDPEGGLIGGKLLGGGLLMRGVLVR